MTSATEARNIKRAILNMNGIYLPDDEIDSAYLFHGEDGGVVCRFKAGINLKDWRFAKRTCE